MLVSVQQGLFFYVLAVGQADMNSGNLDDSTELGLQLNAINMLAMWVLIAASTKSQLQDARKAIRYFYHEAYHLNQALKACFRNVKRGKLPCCTVYGLIPLEFECGAASEMLYRLTHEEPCLARYLGGVESGVPGHRPRVFGRDDSGPQ